MYVRSRLQYTAAAAFPSSISIQSAHPAPSLLIKRRKRSDNGKISRICTRVCGSVSFSRCAHAREGKEHDSHVAGNAVVM